MGGADEHETGIHVHMHTHTYTHTTFCKHVFALVSKFNDSRSLLLVLLHVKGKANECNNSRSLPLVFGVLKF